MPPQVKSKGQLSWCTSFEAQADTLLCSPKGSCRSGRFESRKEEEVVQGKSEGQVEQCRRGGQGYLVGTLSISLPIICSMGVRNSG